MAFPTEPKCRKCGRDFDINEEVFSVDGVPGNNVCWLCATGTREDADKPEEPDYMKTLTSLFMLGSMLADKEEEDE